MLKARLVLEDCKHALLLFQKETQPETFRVLWVGGIALVRAVGHVLHKVDGENNNHIRKSVASAYESWKAHKTKHAIFWEFIEEERNQILKQYEINYFEGPVDVHANQQLFNLDENLFCPIDSGPFAGEDCRDILEQAILWWEKQLSDIEINSK